MNCPIAGTDRERALQQYRLRAPHYDHELAPFEPIRHIAIDRLRLEPGATVLDVGCGTGLSFAPLRTALGSTGQVIGIEQCREMLELARARVAQQGWTHVTLLETPAELTQLARRADAALFHFTHDILRNPDAIAKVVQCLKPGAHVVAVGLQWSDPWAWATNWWVLLAALRSVTSLEGLEQPWSLLAQHLDRLQVNTALGGGVFIASGVLRR